jgi:ankyrin repeat protein
VRRTSRPLLALALIGALALCLGARRVRGPIHGAIETSDGARVEDVVVQLRCLAYAIHGAWPSDEETRIVGSGERFRFWWAWGGVAPAGCSVHAHHPLYLSAYAEVGDGFASDVGTLRLVHWEDAFAAGPTDPPRHEAYPWPAMEIQQHVSGTYHDYVLQHPERSRRRLARYVLPLRATFERAVRLLPTGWHGDSSWNAGLRKSLRQIETAVHFERPRSDRELAEAAGAGDAGRVRALLAAGADPDALGPDGAAPLHLAAQAGHRDAVAALLAGGADIDRQREGAGDTALIDAVQSHRDEVSLLLVERGADVRLASWHGSPLEVAALGNSRPPVVHALVARGAAARAGDDPHVVLALHTASRKGHTTLLTALLDAGVPADATIGPPGWTALMAAAHGGSDRAARLLLAAGADPNARTDDGRTPLSIAREGNRDAVAALLVEAGARE